MSVFRVQKTDNYTVMSNNHLRNQSLSLKAKGLLSLMLSLPSDWDYSLAGLAKINKDAITSVKSAVDELIAEGYVTRQPVRDPNGKFGGYDYNVYELPQLSRIEDNNDTRVDNLPCAEKPYTENPYTENPNTENPNTGNPNTENPQTEKPCSENMPQINKEILNTDSNNNEKNKYDDHHSKDLSDIVLTEAEEKEFGLDWVRKWIKNYVPPEVLPESKSKLLLEDAEQIAKALFIISKSDLPYADKAKEKKVLSTIVMRMEPQKLNSPMDYVKRALANMK